MATDGSTPANGTLTLEEWEKVRKTAPHLKSCTYSLAYTAVNAVLADRPQSWTVEEIRKAILAETTDAMTPPFYDLANRVCKHLQFLYQPAPKTPEEPHVESSGSGTFDVRYGGKYLANFVSEIEAAHYVAALREEFRHG
jgi:hypothetical protein